MRGWLICQKGNIAKILKRGCLLPPQYGRLSNRRCWPSAWMLFLFFAVLCSQKKERERTRRNVIWRALEGSRTGVSWQLTVGIKCSAESTTVHSSNHHHKQLCIPSQVMIFWKLHLCPWILLVSTLPIVSTRGEHFQIWLTIRLLFSLHFNHFHFANFFNYSVDYLLFFFRLML